MAGNAVTVVTWNSKGIGLTIVRAQWRHFIGDAMASGGAIQAAVAKLREWKLSMLLYQLDINSANNNVVFPYLKKKDEKNFLNFFMSVDNFNLTQLLW